MKDCKKITFLKDDLIAGMSNVPECVSNPIVYVGNRFYYELKFNDAYKHLVTMSEKFTQFVIDNCGTITPSVQKKKKV